MSNKGNFEKEFQNVFRQAEVEPDKRVWTGIELELEKAAAQRTRRYLRVFQWLAAASFVFAAGSAALYLLSDKTSKPSGLTSHQSYNSQPLASNDTESASQNGGQQGLDFQREIPVNDGRTQSAGAGKSSEPAENILVIPAHHSTEVEKADGGRLTGWGKKVNVYEISKPPMLVGPLKVSLPDNSPDAGQVLLVKLADEERRFRQEEKKKPREKLWTSVGFGAGRFNPNVSAPTSFSMASVPVTAGSGTGSGMAYSFAAHVAYRAGKKLVIQGGFSYLNQQASYTSSTANVETARASASLNEFVDREDNLVVTAPYEVNGSLQYISFPFQAGVVLIDHDFGLMINGGLATDFFVQSVLTPQTAGYERYVTTPGDESPYRNFYLTGLAGTELSYRFGEKYRIALAPGVRYALQSIYKSDIATEVMPVTYDVSFRFRYIFR